MGKIVRFEIPEGTKGVPCRSCAETIFFIPRVKDPTKKHPVNADGQSHFASCPEAEEGMSTEDEKKVVPIRILRLLLLGVVVDSIKVIDRIHDLGDAVYIVREHELKGWEGPKVEEYSKAVSDLRKALKDLEGMA